MQVTASADSKAGKAAVAGAVSLGLMLSSTAQVAHALTAEDLYKKVEPERVEKTRFAGTEVEDIRSKPAKKAPSPAAASSEPAPAKAAPAKAKKAAKKSDSEAGNAGAAAAAVALIGLAAANATRSGDESSSSSSAPAAAASSGGVAGVDLPTAEERAADAQKWIDAWKKTQ